MFQSNLQDFPSLISELKEALMAPAKYPGSSGTRNLHDNLSDLRAQVAANHKVSLKVLILIDGQKLFMITCLTLEHK